MHLEARSFRIFSAENYDDQFKLLWAVEENLADIFLSHMVECFRLWLAGVTCTIANVEMFTHSCEENWCEYWQWPSSASAAAETAALAMRWSTSLPVAIGRSSSAVWTPSAVTSSSALSCPTCAKNFSSTLAPDRHLRLRPAYRYGPIL